MIKSIKISSKYLNKNKFNQINYFDEYILDIKNLMSQDIYQSLYSLSTLSKNEFSKQYVKYKTEFFTPWEMQNLYQMVVGLYFNSIKKKQQNLQIRLQKSIKISCYKKKTKWHNVGDLKEFNLTYKSSNLTKLIKYMIYIDLDNHENIMNNSKLSEIYNYYKSKFYFDRIILLIQSIQTRVLKSVKLIDFTTGTHSKSFCESGNKTYLCSELIKDESNSKFKYWFKYKNKIKDIFIPVQINQQYHNDMDKLISEQKQFLVKI